MDWPLAILTLLLAEVPPSLPARPHILAVRTATPPVIDGRLDDAVWRAALPSGDFTQHFPDEGAPATERTEVRILYDDDALYLGIDCDQSHAPITKRLTRRDSQLPSDGVWVDIDSRRDRVSAFHFGVSAAGVLSDGLHFNDTDFSTDWDAVWQAKVADNDHGYSIELRIPLRVLRFTALPEQDWGLQIRRLIDVRQETDDWAFYPRSSASYVPYFGTLERLVGLKARRPVEFVPFVLGRLRHRTNDASADGSTTPGRGGTDFRPSIGLNAKVDLSSAFAFHLTLNPDFGQVEADTLVLNLSTIETVFTEKRPFFLEGIDTFTTLQPLLYTRRIGRQPTPLLDPGEIIFGVPEPAPIYGAAKAVGMIGEGTSVGVLSAVTGPNDVAVQTTSNTVVARPQPLTTYNILRLKRLVSGNADAGFMGTATNRFETGAPPPTCPGTGMRAPAADHRCTSDAYALSLDGRWRSPGGDYFAVAQAIATTLRHGPDRLSRDGIPVRPGTASGTAAVILGKNGGEHWLFATGQLYSGREYEINDVGFTDRKNDYQSYYNVSYRTVKPWWVTVETRTTLQLDKHVTGDGIGLGDRMTLSTWWNLASFWAFTANVYRMTDHFDDREMGDGTALERVGAVGVDLTVTSDPRRRVVALLFARADRLTHGLHYEAHAQATFRLLPQFELDFMPTGTYDKGEPRNIVTTSDITKPVSVGIPGQYLLGEQDARSVGGTVRAAYTFTPELSFQLYTQVFLAAVHYPQLFTATATSPRQRLRISELQTAPASTTNYDSEAASLNVSAVLRWEFRGMRSRGLSVCAMALGILVGARGSPRAAASARLVYLRGPGAEQCAGEPAVRAAVSARLGYDPFFDRAPETLFVEIQRGGRGFRLVVKLVDENSRQRGAREISAPGDDCSILIDAVGLSVSLTIDPMSALGSPPRGAPPPSPAARPAEASPEVALVHQPPPPAAPAARSEWSPRAGVGAVGSSNAAPSTTVGATFLVGVGWRALSLDLEGRIDAPATGDSNLRPVKVRSWLLAGALVPCVHHRAVFGCPVVSVGRLGATARNVRSAVDRDGPWSAAGIRAGAEWMPRPPLSVQVYAQMLATLTRDTLWIDGTRVYELPAWSGGLGLALAWRFW